MLLKTTDWPQPSASFLLTMRPGSDAYTLIVRQGPERAKAFPGPPAKEKGKAFTGHSWHRRNTDPRVFPEDRKPVDPPPIVQLRIRDPEDPAQ